MEGDEACDDGELNGDYDHCTADCSGPGPSCGDGSVDGPESCDDGANNGAYGGCALDCAGPAGFCGDGNLDAEFEDCDDGDGIDGNGCNNDCIVSGSTLWELTKTTIGKDSNDIGRDVQVLAGGSLRVASISTVNPNLQRGLITDYDLDGNELGDHAHDNAGYPLVNMDVAAVHPEGTYNIYRWASGSDLETVDARTSNFIFQDWTLTGQNALRATRRAGGGGLYVSESGPGVSADFFILGPDGENVHTQDGSAFVRYFVIGEADSGGDVMLVEDVLTPSGYRPALGRYEDDGTLVYRTEYESDIEDYADNWSENDTVLGVGPEGDVAVAFSSAGTVVVVRFAADGTLLGETQLSVDESSIYVPTDAAFDSAGNLIVSGRFRDGFDFDGVIWKLDPEGEVLWSRTLVGPASLGYESITALTILDDDSIVAAGSFSLEAQHADIWVSRLAP